MTRLSVAVPVYNEEALLPELLARTLSVLDAIPGGPHELVIVDDGSTDTTLRALRGAMASDERIVCVELSRNFGHQAALSAALRFVTGDLVVIMDGDLQDPPEAIPRLLEKRREGYDVVYARRVRRKERWPLRLAYFLAYRLIGRFASIPVPLDAGDFALLSREVVDHLNSLPELNRYLRGLRAWVGFRQIGVDVERGVRTAGTSKYSTAKLVKLALDGLFSFSSVPLRAAALLGFLAVGAASVYAAYAILVHLLFDVSPRGFTALIVVLVFLSGVQLLFLGVLGEYLGRIYEETKRRPQFIVRSVVRGGPPSGDERG